MTLLEGLESNGQPFQICMDGMLTLDSITEVLTTTIYSTQAPNTVTRYFINLKVEIVMLTNSRCEQLRDSFSIDGRDNSHSK